MLNDQPVTVPATDGYRRGNSLFSTYNYSFHVPDKFNVSLMSIFSIKNEIILF